MLSVRLGQISISNVVTSEWILISEDFFEIMFDKIKRLHVLTYSFNIFRLGIRNQFDLRES